MYSILGSDNEKMRCARDLSTASRKDWDHIERPLMFPVMFISSGG